MITTHPIRFVSLGPGEPDLITLKGLKALQGADCIFCPATMTQDGKSSSRALSILNTLGFSDTVQCFRLPMDKDRTLALRSYEAVYESSKILRAEGQNVVIVAEGDAGLYSSIHYIYDKTTSPLNRLPVFPLLLLPERWRACILSVRKSG